MALALLIWAAAHHVELGTVHRPKVVFTFHITFVVPVQLSCFLVEFDGITMVLVQYLKQRAGR